uniref:ATP-dependent helicase CHD1-2/hrp3 HTH domain-containing protein n=1 Tax=Peronospora matthiolae TaxID=2874970 RepID=A0AAV1VM63_9STRA
MTGNLQDTHVLSHEEDKDALPANAGDDSSSSSSGSGSSSSSSSSDSESDEEAETGDAAGARDGAPAGGSHSRADGFSGTSGGPSLSAPRAHGMAATAKTMNVNSTRAAARFKASETESMMPLGTRKRDRRTIEEIQRDLRDKRKKPAGTLSARSSPPPPRGSPIRSPEAEAAVDSGAPMAVGGPIGQFGTAGRLSIKRKPVSAHDRLAMKLNGRKRTGAKKPTKLAAPSGTMPPVLVMTSKPMIKPMAATTTAVTTENSSSSEHGGDTGGDGYNSSVSRSPQAAVDGKVVRAVLRAMLRYGDLTDVGLYPTATTFADEYKMPSFVERATLQTITNVSTDRLHALAHEVAQKAKEAVEARPPHDNIKIADVEARSTHIIERLYENLKLRIAVQRALRVAGCSSGNAHANAQGAYVLVAKQSDLSILGVNTRDLLNWTWAEKDYDWSQRKDAALLLGVYVHGFGGWEDILNDDLLHFQGQRALKGERLKKRAENLLKRLPPPDFDAGDPRIVQLASSFGPGGTNSSQSLGAQFSAIIQSGSIAGVTASVPAASTSGCGRMVRAAERFAARQQNGEKTASRHPVASSNGSAMPNGQTVDGGRQHNAVATKATAESDLVDHKPEDGEIGGVSPTHPTVLRHKRRSSSVDIRNQTSSRKRQRKDNTESSSKNDKLKKGHRRRDRHKSRTHPQSTSVVSGPVVEVGPLPLLSVDACFEKWKPNKKLQEIRLVLKKMKIMAEWSRNQNDETVVEKVFKYVSTIGEAIDRIVTQHQDTVEVDLPSREADELCTSLWTYAAGFTPFTPLGFERLYDDMCADADALVAAKS